MSEKKRKRRNAPGAGRPIMEDEKMEQHVVSMPPSLWDLARALGGGPRGASRGIREALKKIDHHEKKDLTR